MVAEVNVAMTSALSANFNLQAFRKMIDKKSSSWWCCRQITSSIAGSAIAETAPRKILTQAGGHVVPDVVDSRTPG